MKVNFSICIALLSMLSYIKTEENSDENSLFAEEWKNKMSDYEPHYVYNLPIGSKKYIQLFEDIDVVPARIRGAFITNEDDQDKIDFTILMENQGIFYHNTTNQAIFDFEVKRKGKMRIEFNNKHVDRELSVTFTMDSAQNPILKSHHLSPAEEKIKELSNFFSMISLEDDILRKNFQERIKSNRH